MTTSALSKRLFFWLLPVVLTSCLDGAHYENNKALADSEWYADDPAVFEFDIQDTISTYNLILNLRHGATYPYANIYFFSELSKDSVVIVSDTLQYFLADKSGAWVGETGLGDMVENHLMYKPKYRFKTAGEYKLRLEQGMRENPLTPIYDIGFRVEKSR